MDRGHRRTSWHSWSVLDDSQSTSTRGVKQYSGWEGGSLEQPADPNHYKLTSWSGDESVWFRISHYMGCWKSYDHAKYFSFTTPESHTVYYKICKCLTSISWIVQLNHAAFRLVYACQNCYLLTWYFRTCKRFMNLRFLLFCLFIILSIHQFEYP